MAQFYKYNRESQEKYTPNHYEPFLKNVPKEKLFTLPTDKTTEDNRIRILPPWSQEGMFAKVTMLHFNVGILRTTFVCPDLFEEGTCPFCPVVAILKSEYDKNLPDISAAGAKLRAYSNILLSKKPEQGAFVYSYGSKIYYPIKKFQDDGEYGDVTDPIEGRDIIINRKVHGKNKFEDMVYPAPKTSKLMNPDALDQLTDLDTILPDPDMQKVHTSFKSHPWKIYTPPVNVSVPREFETKTTKVDDQIPNYEVPKSVGVPEDTKAAVGKIDELERKLLEKMANRANK